MGNLARVVGMAVAWLAAGVAAGTEDGWSLAIWTNPVFRNQFLGTYGVRAEVEPSLTVVEREQMEKIAAWMGVKGGTAKAQALLETLAKPGQSALFDFTLANLYFQKEDLRRAARGYERALAKYPTYLRALKNLGLVRVRAGEHEKAVAPLTRAIELGATEGLTYGLLGMAYLMTDRFNSAESAYRQAVLLQPDTVDWKLGLARALLKQRKYEETASLCDELIAGDPAKTDYWLLQANAFLGMEQPLKAAENYEYLALAGSATPSALNMLGDIYVNEGASDLALGAYLRAVQADGEGGADVYVRDCEVLAVRGAHAEAERLVSNVLQRFEAGLAPAQRKRLLKVQARLAAATGSDGAGRGRLLEEIVRMDPLDGEALILLGQHHAQAGDLPRAALQFERAAAIPEFEAQACLRHGQALVRAQRYEEALPLLKRAHDRKPGEDLAKYVQQVEQAARAIK
jgi:tetratricopeptide (TPR) repeat protein